MVLSSPCSLCVTAMSTAWALGLILTTAPSTGEETETWMLRGGTHPGLNAEPVPLTTPQIAQLRGLLQTGFQTLVHTMVSLPTSKTTSRGLSFLVFCTINIGSFRSLLETSEEMSNNRLKYSNYGQTWKMHTCTFYSLWEQLPEMIWKCSFQSDCRT